MQHSVEEHHEIGPQKIKQTKQSRLTSTVSSLVCADVSCMLEFFCCLCTASTVQIMCPSCPGQLLGCPTFGTFSSVVSKEQTILSCLLGHPWHKTVVIYIDKNVIFNFLPVHEHISIFQELPCYPSVHLCGDFGNVWWCTFHDNYFPLQLQMCRH